MQQAYLSGSSNLNNLGHPCQMQYLGDCDPLNPANVLCISQHYLPFPTIFYGSVTNISKHATVYTHSQK